MCRKNGLSCNKTKGLLNFRKGWIHSTSGKKTFEIDSTLGIFDSSELQNQKMKNLSLKFSKDSWDFNLNLFCEALHLLS